MNNLSGTQVCRRITFRGEACSAGLNLNVEKWARRNAAFDAAFTEIIFRVTDMNLKGHQVVHRGLYVTITKPSILSGLSSRFQVLD